MSVLCSHLQASEQDILKYVVKWGEQQLIKRMADRGKIIHHNYPLSNSSHRSDKITRPPPFPLNINTKIYKPFCCFGVLAVLIFLNEDLKKSIMSF